MATINALNNRSAPFTVTAGDMTVTAGNAIITSGNITMAATTSSAIGVYTVNGSSWIHSYGQAADENTFVGKTAGNFTMTLGSAFGNTAIGSASFNGLTTGHNNCGLGYHAGISITTGSENTLIGRIAGSNYTSSESSNICIGAEVSGTAGESNVCRIGSGTGTGSGQIATTIINGAITGGSSITATTSLTATSGNVTITAGNLSLPNTTNTPTGEIQFNGLRWISNFGSNNCFVGQQSGNTTTTGAGGNTGVGSSSLIGLTSSVSNAAFGYISLTSLTSGTGLNTAIGYAAGWQLVTGANNCLIGNIAGQNYTGSESSNIVIGSGVGGTAGESNVVRIGTQGSSAQQQNKCFIAGITGVTVTGSAVLCSTTGALGTIASSARFKDNIVDMTESEVIHQFRPVTFIMKNDETKHKQWGLIAEEVQEIYPELVNSDEDGNPYSVRYLDLIPMLLKEVQILRKEVDALKGVTNV